METTIKRNWFEFKDWEKALACFHAYKGDRRKVRLIIDGDELTSGYWVEDAESEKLPGELASFTEPTIGAFEERLRKELELRKTGNGKIKGIIL